LVSHMYVCPLSLPASPSTGRGNTRCAAGMMASAGGISKPLSRQPKSGKE